MSKDDKQLLITDLCGRLPYGVKVRYMSVGETMPQVWDLIGMPAAEHCDILVPNERRFSAVPIQEVKPYLRPIDSMTIEELEDYARHKFASDKIWEIAEFRNAGWFLNVKCKNKNDGGTWTFQVKRTSPLEDYKGIDWLNSHFFDYRGLLKNGLALKAPEDMYDFSNRSTGNGDN